MSYDQSASQGGGFFEGMGGAGGDAGADRRKDSELGLRPVTIRQIQQVETDSPDMPLMIDDKEVKNVTFVGRVVDHNPGDLFSSFKVDDGTGVVDCKLWSTEGNPLPVAEDEYARVRGVVKQFQGTTTISATTVHKVTDPNELVFHNLQAIWSHLYLTKGGDDADRKPSVASTPASGPLDRLWNVLKELSTENVDGVLLPQFAKRMSMSTNEADTALQSLVGNGRAYNITGANDEDLYFPMYDV